MTELEEIQRRIDLKRQYIQLLTQEIRRVEGEINQIIHKAWKKQDEKEKQTA